MRLLLIEDEKRLAEALSHMLKQNNYLVDIVHDGVEGYDNIMTDIYDIVILDVMLPGMNGFEILKKVRSEGITTSILMLTAKSEMLDRVSGLDFGADDYLTKPFAVEELLARLRALGRRKELVFTTNNKRLGNIIFDEETLKLSSPTNYVNLTHLENELLSLLFSRIGMITSKEMIIVKLWGYESNAEDNNVEVYISFLRKKLRYLQANVSIKTTRSVGYSLEVETDV